MKDQRFPAERGKSNEVSRVTRGKLDPGKARTAGSRVKQQDISHYH